MLTRDAVEKEILRRLEGLGVVSFKSSSVEGSFTVRVVPYPGVVFFEYTRCLVRIVDSLQREYRIQGCEADRDHVCMTLIPRCAGGL